MPVILNVSQGSEIQISTRSYKNPSVKFGVILKQPKGDSTETFEFAIQNGNELVLLIAGLATNQLFLTVELLTAIKLACVDFDKTISTMWTRIPVAF